MNIMSKRYFFFALSLLIIIPGIILMFVWGLPLSIDFKGGSLLDIKFPSGQAPEPAKVVELYSSLGVSNAQVVSSGKDELIIRSTVVDQALQTKAIDTINKTFSTTVTVLRSDSIGPTLAQEVTTRGLGAILMSSVVLAIFIAWAFRNVQNSWHYGICTVIALLHDVLVILSITVIGGHFFGWQVDTLFLTALLTVIAFSAQDTIVVFDRIRENSQVYRRVPFEKLVNHSVVQSLTRSINTQIMAVDFLLLALALFGGVTLREFALILLVGMLSGSYSSGFNAAPLLIVWQNQEWKNWFGRGKAKSTTATGNVG
jgi:preprotein translocase subunit SecF